MDKLEQQEKTLQEIQQEPEYILADVDEDAGVAEEILRNVILAYERAWNKNNDKNECRYTLTLTKHKVATPDGNKDVAYLRLDRMVRPRSNNDQNPDEGWTTQLIHQEVYFFRGIKEQVDPRRLWVEQLYMNCIGRLLGAGLEYADLLRKLKNVKENKESLGISDEVQERAAKSNLVITNEMPKPLSPEDEKYKEWLANERKKEGLN